MGWNNWTLWFDEGFEITMNIRSKFKACVLVIDIYYLIYKWKNLSHNCFSKKIIANSESQVQKFNTDVHSEIFILYRQSTTTAKFANWIVTKLFFKYTHQHQWVTYSKTRVLFLEINIFCRCVKGKKNYIYVAFVMRHIINNMNDVVVFLVIVISVNEHSI